MKKTYVYFLNVLLKKNCMNARKYFMLGEYQNIVFQREISDFLSRYASDSKTFNFKFHTPDFPLELIG